MHIRTLALPAAVLFAVLAVAGCKKKEAEAPPVATPATVPAPLPPPAPLTTGDPMEMPAGRAAATVQGVELGNAVGPDRRVTAVKSTFAPRDKIIAAVSTQTADVAATVPAKLTTKWTHVSSDQVVNEESRDVELKGSQVWDFQIANPEPWPVGKYRVEVSLDGNVVSAKGFEVK